MIKIIMASKSGYDVTFHGEKCLSISTGEQPDGTHQFFINTLGGPGVQRHLHAFVTLSSEGIMVKGGVRIKNNVGEYLSTSITLNATTQEIARVVIKRDRTGIISQLKQTFGDDWIATKPSTHIGKMKRQPIALPSSTTATSGEYSISLFDAGTELPPTTEVAAIVSFSTMTSFGVAFTEV